MTQPQKSNKEAKLLRKKNAIRVMYKDMLLFGKKCLPDSFKVKSPDFHREIASKLMNLSLKRVLIAAPRGTSKSTLVSLLYVIYRLMFKRKGEKVFIVIISESRPQAINFLSRVKNKLTTSKELHYYFGDRGESTARRWREDDIILSNGDRIVAIGTGSKIRGFIEGDNRPTDIICDDIESEKNASTPEARAKNRKWVTEAVIQSLAKAPERGRLIYIGTVISEDCFLYWAKDSPSWEVLWYKIIKDDGKSLWREVYPLKEIERIREEFASVGNISGFFQEFMNEAQSPEDAPFKPSYIKIHNYKLFYDKEVGSHYLMSKGSDDNKKPVNVYMGIDPSSSLSSKADFFVIATIAIDAEGIVYLMKEGCVHDRIDPAMQADLIIKLFKKIQPDRVTIETVAYQEMLRATVRKIMLDENIYIHGIEKGEKPRNSKTQRLLSLVPLLAKGKFYFFGGSLDAQAEFLSFPKGKHDDWIDAIWYAMKYAKPCRMKEIETDNITTKNNKLKIFNWMTR